MFSRPVRMALALAALATAPAARAQLTDPIPAPIPNSNIPVRLVSQGGAFPSPVQVLFPHWGGRAFVVDQTGRVFLIKKGVVQATPFLDISALFTDLQPAFPGATTGLNPGYDERGLLAMAFHPGFFDAKSPGHRTLYTLHNVPVTRRADFPEPPYPSAGVTPNCQEVIAEWKVTPRTYETVDASSYREVLRNDKPEFNHDGGTLLFGPDGMLYASFGDGGNKNDIGDGHNPEIGNGQDLTTILGKVIRINPLNPRLTSHAGGLLSTNGQYRIPRDNPFVDRRGALKEIYAYGFRNPFRMSWDAAAGGLIVADVGQDSVEEVDIVRRGQNYGWPLREGKFQFNRDTGAVMLPVDPNPELVNPVLQYDHDDFEKPGVEVPIAIVGGFVYRGSAIPRLTGKYVFADFTGIVFAGDLKTGKVEKLTNAGMYVKGFGEDTNREIYLLATPDLGPSGNRGVILALKPGAPR